MLKFCVVEKDHQILRFFFNPTIISCPKQALRIVDTELFGPVLSVLTFRDEQEVIKLANDTKHGLALEFY